MQQSMQQQNKAASPPSEAFDDDPERFVEANPIFLLVRS